MTPEILRLLILLVVFVTVMLLAEQAIGAVRRSRGYSTAINKRIALISRGVSRDEILVKLRRARPDDGFRLPGPFSSFENKLERELSGAGFKISASRIALILLGATIGLFLLAVWLVWLNGIEVTPGRLMLLGTVASAAGFGLPVMVLGRLAAMRRKKLTEQFPVALDVFVRGLRAGHPVAAALELVANEMSDPIGSEFGIVLDEVTYGAELRDALQNMADRCGVEDMQMFVVSLSIQAETGGNLAEILDNLAKVIRDRAAMLLKVRALSSEGRMTAFMLTALPIFALVLLFIGNPAFYLDVADDPYFIPGFGALLLAFFIGVMWIRKLVDLKV